MGVLYGLVKSAMFGNSDWWTQNNGGLWLSYLRTRFPPSPLLLGVKSGVCHSFFPVCPAHLWSVLLAVPARTGVGTFWRLEHRAGRFPDRPVFAELVTKTRKKRTPLLDIHQKRQHVPWFLMRLAQCALSPRRKAHIPIGWKDFCYKIIFS